MASPKTTALTREAAWKAKQMYEEKDERGRRKWTIMQIADALGVGETTAYRAVKSIGPYQSLPEVKPPEQVDQDAKESLKRLLAMQEGEKEKPPEKDAVDIYMERRAGGPPISPLDGGDVPDETDGTVREKFARAVALRDPIRNFNELMNEGGETDGKDSNKCD